MRRRFLYRLSDGVTQHDMKNLPVVYEYPLLMRITCLFEYIKWLINVKSFTALAI